MFIDGEICNAWFVYVTCAIVLRPDISVIQILFVNLLCQITIGLYVYYQ